MTLLALFAAGVAAIAYDAHRQRRRQARAAAFGRRLDRHARGLCADVTADRDPVRVTGP